MGQSGWVLKWEQLVVDARDPVSLGNWWARALDWVVVNDDPDDRDGEVARLCPPIPKATSSVCCVRPARRNGLRSAVPGVLGAGGNPEGSGVVPSMTVTACVEADDAPES